MERSRAGDVVRADEKESALRVSTQLGCQVIEKDQEKQPVIQATLKTVLNISKLF